MNREVFPDPAEVETAEEEVAEVEEKEAEFGILEEEEEIREKKIHTISEIRESLHEFLKVVDEGKRLRVEEDPEADWNVWSRIPEDRFEIDTQEGTFTICRDERRGFVWLTQLRPDGSFVRWEVDRDGTLTHGEVDPNAPEEEVLDDRDGDSGEFKQTRRKDPKEAMDVMRGDGRMKDFDFKPFGNRVNMRSVKGGVITDTPFTAFTSDMADLFGTLIGRLFRSEK